MARKRRGRGEGSIYKRGDGTWVGSISAGYNAQGKRQRATAYGKTKKEVQEELRQLQTEGTPNVPRMTVGEFLDRWLEDTVKPSLAPSTHQRYRYAVDGYIKPHVGHLQLTKLTPMHVQHMYRAQTKAKASARNRQMAGTVLQTAMQSAVQLRLIPFNPCLGIDKARPQKREMQVWDKGQVDAFLKEAKSDRLHALYALAVATGMRQGELLALEWSDVDLKGATVSVNRTLENIEGRLRPKEPKTAKSRRRIDLPRFAVDALVDHRKVMMTEGLAGSPIVFCDSQGGYLRASNIRRRSFLPLANKANIPVIRFHDLRHTAATLLLLAGENPNVVSERLGHASIQITLDTYSHVLPSMQKAAADKLDKLFG